MHARCKDRDVAPWAGMCGLLTASCNYAPLWMIARVTPRQLQGPDRTAIGVDDPAYGRRQLNDA